MASFTAPTIHVTGDDLPVTDYNAVANNTTFLYQAPYAYAYNSGNVSVPDITATKITLDTFLFSGYGWSISSNNLIVPLTGIYQTSSAVFLSTGTGFVIVYLSLNGSTSLASVVQTTASGATAAVSGLVKCTAGDALSLVTQQSSGSETTLVSAVGLTFLNVSFVGSV